MNTVFYLLFIAILPAVIFSAEEEEDEIVWELPFDKSKVNYHRSKVCITKKGKTKCVSKNHAPGDPKSIVSLFKDWQKHSVLSEETNKANDKNDDNDNGSGIIESNGGSDDRIDGNDNKNGPGAHDRNKLKNEKHEDTEVERSMKETLPNYNLHESAIARSGAEINAEKTKSLLRAIAFMDLNH
ncbi:hypothetical protein O0L34_g15336 [Tuta absoluta]|nr:hypothetical protein O0L34_g15336 [Tuta absoluta]